MIIQIKNIPTQLKEWLIEKLESIITLPYKIIDHKASIRPTTMIVGQ